jgi:hypothetical protein
VHFVSWRRFWLIDWHPATTIPHPLVACILGFGVGVVLSICSWKLLHSTQVGSTEICLLACNLKFGKHLPIWLLALKGPASSCWWCQKNCHKDLLWVFSVIGGQCYPAYLFLRCFGRHFRKQNMHILIYTWEYGVSAVFKFDNLLIFQVMLACKFHSKKIRVLSWCSRIMSILAPFISSGVAKFGFVHLYLT